MKKIMFGLIVSTISLWASSSIGTATAQFLEVNLNTQNMGMGNASTSIITGSASMLINPAGLAELGRGSNDYDSYFSFVNWPAEITFASANLGFSLGKIGVLGINSVFANYGDEILTTAANPMGDGTFSMSSYAVGLTFSRYLTDKFSFGLNVKMVGESFDRSNYSQLAYDLGTLYRTGYRNLNIGMSVLHFSNEAKFSGKFFDYSASSTDSSDYETWPLPMTFRTGLSMDIYSRSQLTISAAFDMIHTNNSSEKYGLGTELLWMQRIVIRAGYQFGTDIEGISAGLGLKISDLMQIDYAFNAMEYLGGRHRFGIKIGF